MSRSIIQKSIAATLGAAVVSTGLFVSISSYAQSGTPGTMTPSPAATPSTTTPGGMSNPGTAPASATPAAGKTIVSIAAGNKNFTTLVTALKAADLVETLSGEGPYTVFAPTNAAFAKLPKATLANLLKPANKEQLKKVLTYHVVSGTVTSKQLKSGPVATVQGGNVTVKISGKKVKINNANVVLADVKGSNGVIHAIDTVLIPAK
ncbi:MULTISPECIES: fasciclin domain-containing protein [unclassified Chamaesiphon]|uniref:fasciclin domain-containing protein n=1 Tax=unclassified Chamaesiphon TaxID=2620921 RepID=UPI00286CFE83|nr:MULTISPECIES: fasciclin domain-containing protein [unclassified Chamaesiphon]